MQSFRTILPPLSGQLQIQPDDHLLCLGSCFAQHIGDYFKVGRWSVDLNPFGILYHPFPMVRGLERLLNETFFTEEDLFFHQEQWHSFDHHGQFSGLNPKEVLTAINQRLSKGSNQLKKASFIILTLGTTNGFVEISSGQVVANCHKLPSQRFNKTLFTQEAIQQRLAKVIKRLTKQFPKLKIIITVSPVRHLRDGLITNQRSKASLLLAAAKLEKEFSAIHYFPAYELMMDDLRDYRFYKNDLMHPTKMAVDYIWEYFRKSYFSEATKIYYEEVLKINKELMHRPRRPDSAAHQRFVEQLKKKISVLQKKYPHLNFEDNTL